MDRSVRGCDADKGCHVLSIIHAVGSAGSTLTFPMIGVAVAKTPLSLALVRLSSALRLLVLVFLSQRFLAFDTTSPGRALT